MVVGVILRLCSSCIICVRFLMGVFFRFLYLMVIIGFLVCWFWI